MAVVVSDTSPLRALAHLGYLPWLQDLFGHVVLPPAVAFELENPPTKMAAVDVSAFSFLHVRTPRNMPRIVELSSSLDAGEAEAIALAEELQAELVLIDELAGREVACQRGFRVLGTLGILLRAKELGFCPAVAPLLDRLKIELNFFVSAALRQFVLRQAGESTR